MRSAFASARRRPRIQQPAGRFLRGNDHHLYTAGISERCCGRFFQGAFADNGGESHHLVYCGVARSADIVRHVSKKKRRRDQGTLPLLDLVVSVVVSGQLVWTWLSGGGRYGPDPGGGDVCLRPPDSAPNNGGGMSRRFAQRTFFDSVAVLILVVMLFPIYWMVSTALKPGKEILSLTPVW